MVARTVVDALILSMTANISQALRPSLQLAACFWVLLSWSFLSPYLVRSLCVGIMKAPTLVPLTAHTLKFMWSEEKTSHEPGIKYRLV